MLKLLVDYYKFDVEVLWGSLSVNVYKVVLYGFGKENIEFKYMNDCGDIFICCYLFEGVLYNMECCYKEMEFSVVCEELVKFISNCLCVSCEGMCLCWEVCYVYVENMLLFVIFDMSIGYVMEFFNNFKFVGQWVKIVEKIFKEIGDCLKFFVNVGLNYLMFFCLVEMFFGGEVQCICLVSQIGVGLVGVMYVLDELFIGLYQCDNECLLGMFIYLCDFGNIVIVVEYDEDVICVVDYVIDIGLGVGVYGGEVVVEGLLEVIMVVLELLIGQYMSGKCKIEVLKKCVLVNLEKVLKLIGVCGNNLKDVMLMLLVGLFICIIGVLGFGKLMLINDILFLIV